MVTISDLIANRRQSNKVEEESLKKRDDEKRFVMRIYKKELPNRDNVLVMKNVIVVYDRHHMRNIDYCLCYDNRVYKHFLKYLDYYRANNTLVVDLIGIEKYNNESGEQK